MEREAGEFDKIDRKFILMFETFELLLDTAITPIFWHPPKQIWIDPSSYLSLSLLKIIDHLRSETNDILKLVIIDHSHVHQCLHHAVFFDCSGFTNFID